MVVVTLQVKESTFNEWDLEEIIQTGIVNKKQ